MDATKEQIAAVLLGAADVIAEKGWCQYALRDYAGRVCARGAIITAIGVPLEHGFVESWSDGDLRLFEAADDALYSHIEAPVPLWRHVPDWNNDPATTAEDVLLTFKRAAYSLTAESPPVVAGFSGEGTDSGGAR